MIAIYGYFIKSRTSFIWGGDSFHQHYPIFREFIGMIKDFIQNPFEGFQLWDWTIGLGSDVIAAYGYYVIGDPFVYLGVFFPESMLEFAYHLLILLRVYCIGFAFVILAKKLNLSGVDGVIGALTYTFSYFVIYDVIRHPFFLMPMILYPLLCLGIEKILRNESNILFIVIIFISIISNFYFFYMLTILTFIFAIFRYFNMYGKQKFIHFFKLFWKALYSYLIGFLMGGTLFLPSAWGFLTSSRESGTEFASGMLIYPFQYYWRLITNLFVSDGYLWTMTGFSAIFILVIPLLFRKKEKYSFLTKILILFFIMTLLPAFGSIMNGFAGPSNRWTFAIPLFISLAISVFIKYRYEYTLKDYLWMGYSILIFLCIAELAQLRDGFNTIRFIPVLIALTIWIILALNTIYHKHKEKRTVLKLDIFSIFLILILVMFNLVFNAREYYYPGGKNGMNVLLEYGTVDQKFKDTFDGAEKFVSKDVTEISRIGITSRDRSIPNNLMYLGEMGTTSYLSITNGYVAELMKQTDVANYEMNKPVRNGLDDRQILNNFLGVQHIITDKKNENYLPNGYQVIHETKDENGSIVAETEDVFPFAYTSNSYITEKEFENLNPVEKEEYLSYGYVSKEELINQEKLNFSSNVENINVELINSENISLTTKDTILIEKKNTTIEMNIDEEEKLKDKELFVYLEGLDFRPLNNSSLARENLEYEIKASFNGKEKTIVQKDVLNLSAYVKRDTMLFSLGHQQENLQDEKNKIILSFSRPGDYKVEGIKVLALPIGEQYKERVADKKENKLRISLFENQKIVGEISQEDPTMLVTSIPYSEGWEAKVNDEKVKIQKINYGFVGVPLNSG
ncbi:MAG: YfhO family protein, partial [Desemzia incerta]